VVRFIEAEGLLENSPARLDKGTSMPFLLRVCGALALLGAISGAFAHPLHGSDAASGLIHPFAGLDHLLAAVAVGMWATRVGGRAMWIVPAGFVSAMLLGCAVALAGYAPVAVEPMIAASVAAFGLILFFRFGSGVALATVLAGYFALFHGMAHAAGLDGGAALPFVLGLVCATAALHAIGIALARKLPAAVPAAGAALAAAGAWWIAAAVL
jgi:urease accessory protein